MPRQLHPVSQKIIGWLFLTAGVLLLLGLALQVLVVYYRVREAGLRSISSREMVLGPAMLAAAVLMVRVGWRMRAEGKT